MAYTERVQVRGDQLAVAPQPNSSLTVTVQAGDTVYYRDAMPANASLNQGSLTAGQSAVFSEPIWLSSASGSDVQLSFADGLSPVLVSASSTGGAVPWAANTFFPANRVVSNGGTNYLTQTPHVSGGSFDATKFQALGSGGGGSSLPVTALGAISGNNALTAQNAYTAQITGATTFTLSGASAGKESIVDLYLSTDSTGNYAITWPTIKWLGTASTATAPPPILPGGSLAVTLVSPDSGTTWYGFPSGSTLPLSKVTSYAPATADTYTLTTAGADVNFASGGLLQATIVLPAISNLLITVEALGLPPTSSGLLYYGVREGTTDLGYDRVMQGPASGNAPQRFRTSIYVASAAAGSHTYKFAAFASVTTGTPTVYAGTQAAASTPVGAATIKVETTG